jgi:hypothetical protein
MGHKINKIYDITPGKDTREFFIISQTLKHLQKEFKSVKNNQDDRKAQSSIMLSLIGYIRQIVAIILMTILIKVISS